MNWKIFITAFISVLFISFPQNIIGCADGEDPYDYYTSFFSKGLVDADKVYEPFYYTALLDFYDDWQWDKPVSYEKDPVLAEWRSLCSGATTNDAVALIYHSKKETIDSLIRKVKSAALLPMPVSLKENNLARCITTGQHLEKLQYLSFAKKTEKVSATSDWEAKKEVDSLTVNRLIIEAEKAFAATNDGYLKNKYAFQACKLAFYNNRFEDCIRWYDVYFKNNTKDAVHQLALSYKAGSLFRLGKKAEAAYTFSLAFPLADHNKKQTYLGFLWATDECDAALQNSVTAFAKNDKERANILGMFSLFGQSPRIGNLQQIYKLDRASAFLPVLAIREINKLEEQYLTPLLASEKGGKPYYYFWQEDSAAVPDEQPVEEALSFFKTLTADSEISNRGLYATAAAYLSFMKKDYTGAKSFLNTIQRPDAQLRDQADLLKILIAINEKKVLDKENEAYILPSLNWLVHKTKTAGNPEYNNFLRNLFSEIIAQKYEQQGDQYKAALAYGMADLQFLQTKGATLNNGYGAALEYVRNEMNTEDLLKLYDLQNSASLTPFEKALMEYSSFDRDDVVDVLGTSYLRNFNFEKAVEWLKRSGKPEPLIATKYNYQTDKETIINVNPFHDHLNDWQRYDKPLLKPLNKLSFAQKVLDLQGKADTVKNTEVKARLLYQLGSAFYNMSHYGNSWTTIAYYRSGSDWNTGVYQQQWHKEYYGVYKAQDYYKKAYELTRDKEFKAAAYFMTVKCSQRQLAMPPYDYDNYEQYEKDLLAYEKKFKYNPQFAHFKNEFGTTKFYQYTFTRCSYLRDFVKQQAKDIRKK